MTETNEDVVNLDELQAQIDLSMSATDDLISSWLKTPKIRSNGTGSRNTVDMELQDYLRRPARLGLGAPLPDSSGVAAREEAKLKSKIIANGKKRNREKADQVADTHPDDSDPEDLRKGSAIPQKRLRPDPFSSKSRGNDRVHPSIRTEQATEGATGNDCTDEMESNNAHIPNGSSTLRINGDNSPALPLAASQSPLKKKRKKKKARVIDGNASDIASSFLAATSANGTAKKEIIQEDEDEIWTGFGDHEESLGRDDEGTSSVNATQNGIMEDLSDSKQALPMLLNLSGAPLYDEKNSSLMDSPRRKRKRRKKKGQSLEKT